MEFSFLSQGTGFSYTTNEAKYVTEETTLSSNVMYLLAMFLKVHREFAHLPWYLFGESYGGKLHLCSSVFVCVDPELFHSHGLIFDSSCDSM